MEFNEPNIRTGHPPHSIPYKKNGLFPCRILLKVAIFIIIFIFVLSFNLPHFNPGFNSRKQTIQEILAVLERHQTGLANVTKEELAEVIYEEATRYNHDPKFILAVIAIESEFHNWSVSEKGAKGLMQIMPYVAQSIAQELGIEWSGDRTLFNPILNIRMGIYYLSRLLLDFDDLELAVTAYNYGPTYVKGLIERKERVPLHYYRRLLTVYQGL
ncbi:MAG: transglycosylase SLT domain-containing protein [Thermodesulfobacteriota bacterium]|jgi:soluble lytic murein transglycosylase